MSRREPLRHALDVLVPEQTRVMNAVLDEEERRREHLVVYLSGAHAYGFPSPDSDLDLKAIHVGDTADFLGFQPKPTTFDRAQIIDGVEIDYTSNEIAHALGGIIKGNGNFIERILGRTVPLESPLLAELRPLVQRSLSRRVLQHYRGFAISQLRFVEKEPSAKKLLYVFRTALTGVHLLRTGELEPDLSRIMDEYGLGEARSLIERKRSGERVGIDASLLESWRPRIDAVFSRLEDAYTTSVLPEEPPNVGELQAWLLEVRRARFA
ncbi:hypothetical protein AKJ09_02107 [Labilithrix luteola]|uniref:Nucleotidyltransferase n=1 Tax=Labilithrix luteola TaxID=1391654 RepID=A0A0K1PPJ5_9BACT|nr:nucleotidyltransferase domain-containing protein [Labilithrix luteola]AKU95443.1 hypothetical protein AKJ09_02107 [Labilithrix luteola]